MPDDPGGVVTQADFASLPVVPSIGFSQHGKGTRENYQRTLLIKVVMAPDVHLLPAQVLTLEISSRTSSNPEEIGSKRVTLSSIVHLFDATRTNDPNLGIATIPAQELDQHFPATTQISPNKKD